ncbi:2,3-diaminopropionate biosynthesis protein SbnB [Nonomuraea sp. B12E4]|uniref:2,3-diaminopropionate biosynthesis protein SbnB n=1 Tax=Nonomuraea sp. B12E4 TaxID=3153564 RepID=UPI00325C368D
MSQQGSMPGFSVISGAQVDEVLRGQEKRVIDLVRQAYRAHGEGATTNPASYFLTFPDRPRARIIALPASIGGENEDARVDGLKWISSFPANIDSGLPRASGVLILNDPGTGYPYACLETSIISACRTAASAALAAGLLSQGRPALADRSAARIGFVGTGLIARHIAGHLAATGWSFARTGVYDLDRSYAERFAAGLDGDVTVHDSAEELIRSSDLIVFATVAAAPHITDPAWFAHHPLVLHISLRDLAPEVVLASANVVDDVDHCLRAGTSLHLTEQRTGDRAFVDGTLYDVMAGRLRPSAGRTLVFSPFGLGILDLAVGKHVHDEVRRAGALAVVDGFFHELDRHRRPA